MDAERETLVSESRLLATELRTLKQHANLIYVNLEHSSGKSVKLKGKNKYNKCKKVGCSINANLLNCVMQISLVQFTRARLTF